MAENTFGAGHRQLVQDTNNGVIQSESRAVKSKVSGTGSRTTVGSDGGGKNATALALLDIATPVVDRLVKTDKKERFSESYKNGTEAGLKELKKSQSTIGKLLFGDTTEMRGAQKKIVDNKTVQDYTQQLTDFSRNVASMDSKQYQEHLQDKLNETLEKYSDPEIRAGIIESHSKFARDLAMKHAPAREAHVQAEHLQASLDGMSAAAIAAQRGGDTSVITSALKKDPRMSQEAYQNSIVMGVSQMLMRDNENLWLGVKQGGVWDQLDSQQQRLLEQRHMVYRKRVEDATYHKLDNWDQRASQGIAEAEVVAEEARQAIKTDPYLTDPNKYHPMGVKGEAKKQAKAKIRETNKISYRTLNPDLAAQNKTEQTTAFVDFTTPLWQREERARKTAAASKAYAEDETVLSTDPGIPTTDQLVDYAFSNDAFMLSTVVGQGSKVHNNLITQRVNQSIRDLESYDTNTPEWKKASATMKSMMLIKDRDEGVFNTLTRDESVAHKVTLWASVVDTGFHPNRMVQEVLDGVANPPDPTYDPLNDPSFDVEDYQDDILENMSEATGDYLLDASYTTDEEGLFKGKTFGFARGAANEDLVRDHINTELSRLNTMYQPEVAREVLKRNMQRTTAQVDGILRMGMKSVTNVMEKTTNKDLAEWAAGVDGSNYAQSKIIENNNWPADWPLNHIDNVWTPSADGKGFTIQTPMEIDGQSVGAIIYFDTPTKDNQFTPTPNQKRLRVLRNAADVAQEQLERTDMGIN